MKALIKTAAIAATLLAASGTAYAFTATDVPGVSGGSVNLSINGNSATLAGSVESRFEAQLVENFVKDKYDIDRVNNNITY